MTAVRRRRRVRTSPLEGAMRAALGLGLLGVVLIVLALAGALLTGCGGAVEGEPCPLPPAWRAPSGDCDGLTFAELVECRASACPGGSWAVLWRDADWSTLPANVESMLRPQLEAGLCTPVP